MSDSTRAKEWAETWAPKLAQVEHGDPFVNLLAQAGCAFAAERTAALRLALREEHEAIVEEKVEDWPVHLKRDPGCSVCVLLADAGPHAEAKR